MAGKLSDPILIDELCRRRALGESYRGLAKALKNGEVEIPGEEGMPPQAHPPIEVDHSNLAKALKRSDRQAIIQSKRELLWGNVESLPMSWGGYRIKNMTVLFEEACERMQGSKKDPERRLWHAEARKTLCDLDGMISRLAPSTTEHKHLHLHGGSNANANAELVEVLSVRLSELANSGLLPDAVEAISGNGANANVTNANVTNANATNANAKSK